MAFKASFITLILFITITLVTSVDITYFLQKYPEYKTFSDLLTKTKVADEINKQTTVTVLLLDNAAVGPIAGAPENILKIMLETHVLLDYYDSMKLKQLDGKTENATNLFQSSGQAQGNQGLTHISTKGDETTFASAAVGAPQNAKMVKVVNFKPFSFAAIQIDRPIVTPGMDVSQGGGGSSSSSSSPSGSPQSTPSTIPGGHGVAQPPMNGGSDNAGAPANGGGGGNSGGESPGDAPNSAEDSGEGQGPSGDSEGGAPGSGPGSAPEPSDEGNEGDSEAPAKLKSNSGARLSTLGVGVIFVLIAWLALAP